MFFFNIYFIYLLAVILPKISGFNIDSPYVLTLCLTGLSALIPISISYFFFNKNNNIYLLKNHNLFYLIACFYGLSIGFLYESFSNYPYGLSAFILNKGTHDAIFHSTITTAIKNIGYPSIPINQYVFFPYHAFSNYIYAFNLKFIAPISAVYSIPSVIQLWFAPFIPISIYFFYKKFYLIYFENFFEGKEKNIFICLSVIISALIIFFEFSALTLRSDSMTMTIILTFISLSKILDLDNLKKNNFRSINFLYIFLLLSLFVYSKSASVGIVFFIFIFLCLKNISYILKNRISIIYIFLGSIIFLLSLFLVRNPFQPKVIEFMHFFYEDKCKIVLPYALFNIAFAILFSLFISINYHTKHKKLSLFGKILFISTILSLIPVFFLNIDGCSAIYILLPLQWIALTMPIIFIYDKFKHAFENQKFFILIFIFLFFYLCFNIFFKYQNLVDSKFDHIIAKHSENAIIDNKYKFKFLKPLPLKNSDDYYEWLKLNDTRLYGCRENQLRYYLYYEKIAFIKDSDCKYNGVKYELLK